MARIDCLFCSLALGVIVNKSEYLESRKGELHSVIIASQPTEKVVGSIRGDNLRNVVAILAAGLQYRLDTAQDSPLRTALLTAFKYMTLPDYAINLSLPENVGLLGMAVQAGIVTPEERDQFFSLATYETPVYNITAADFVGEWNELPVTSAQTAIVRLHEKAPEQTYILFQAQDDYGDGTTSDWYHATALHGVELAREYRAPLPFNGYKRKIRWRCEYALDCVVSV